ncbi:MAG: hypothetical protein ACTSPG_06695 [Candidatus Hodarchaeales archaeon]
MPEVQLAKFLENRSQVSFSDYQQSRKEALLSLFVLMIPFIVINSIFLFTDRFAVPITSYTNDNVYS